MALTSALHRRRTSKRNRTIPTIPVESFGRGLVDVSAVDTESRACSTPRCLGGGPASPCYVCPLQAPVLGPGGHGSTPLPAHSCPESVYSARVGKYWPKVVRTARRPQATHPTPVSYFITSETPRSRETTQYLPPSNARPQGRPREPVAGSGAEGPELVGVSWPVCQVSSGVRTAIFQLSLSRTSW